MVSKWRDVQFENGCHCGGSLYPPDQVDCKTYPCEVALLMNSTVEPGVPDADIELTCRALRACGYRIHIKEKCGTRWVTAVKGLDVRYVHWHPLTNINQAMQLLIDAPQPLNVRTWFDMAVCCIGDSWIENCAFDVAPTSPQALIAAQCRAIVTACASLEAVR